MGRLLIDPTLEDFIPRLRADLSRIEAVHAEAAPITWSTFSSEFNAVYDEDSAPTAAFAVAGGIVTLTDAGAAFAVGLVGKYITIRNAPSVINNGTFEVVDVPSPTTVKYQWAKGVSEAQGAATYKIGYSDVDDIASRDAEQKKIIKLTQADFGKGTLRITHPCTLILTEDILFNPNAPAALAGPTRIDPNRVLNWNPDPDEVPSNAQYAIGQRARAYSLDFFAALAIEAEGVIVDLNGYSISFHQEFGLQQRFGAIIELDDQPFLPQQGPSDFGSIIRPAKKVWIKNGTLGGRSHQDVHANSNQDVLYTDVVFRDHEVAAVSMNGAKRVLMESFEDLGSRKDIPVVGTYSALRFTIQFADQIEQELPGALDAVTFNGVAGNALASAKDAENRIFDDVIYDNSGAINSSLATGDPALAVFQNMKLVGGVQVEGTGLIDGPSYGLVFNPTGVAVGPFLESLNEKGMETSCIVIKKGKVNGTKGSIVEVPAAWRVDGTSIQTGPDGAVIQFLNIYQDDDGNPQRMTNADGTYAGTILSNLQIAMAKVKSDNPGMVSSVGRLNIDPAIVRWAQSTLTHLVLQTNVATGEDELRLSDGPDAGSVFAIDYGGDSMHHVIKGMTALRMDGVNDSLIKDVIIADAFSGGALGEGIYINGSDGGHADQLHNGYFGGRMTAARLSSCQNVAVINLSIFELESERGVTVGLEVAGESNDIQVVGARIQGLSAGTKLTETKPAELKELAGYPNPPPVAIALYIHTTAKNVNRQDVVTEGVTSYSGLQEEECPIKDCSS